MTDKPSYEELEQKIKEIEKEVAELKNSKQEESAAFNALDVASDENLYRILFDNASDIIFIHDLSGKPIEFNQVACDRLGHSREELMNMSPENIDTPEQAVFVKDRIDKLIKSGNIIFETEHITRDGKIIPTEVSCKIIEYDGKTAVLSIARDITDRKKAEDALMENERFLRGIINAIQDGISVLDSEFNIVRVNAWMQKTYLDDMPIVGKKCYEVYKKRQSVCPWCPSVKTLEDGKTHSAIVPRPSAEDQVQWMNLSAYPLKNPDGRVTGVIEHIRDITESKRAEEALRQGEARYRELVQNANSIILRRNTEGKITFLNEFAQRFFGYTEDEIIGKNVMGTIVPEIDSVGRDLAAMIRDIALNPEKYAANENENMRKNGERVWVSWTNKAIRDKDENVVEILCIGNDISERKQLEKQLRHALKMESIGTLAGGIAHDFNNLLMGILGNTSLILLKTDSEDPNYKRLKTIEKQIESGSKLTSQLLGYARKGKYELKPIDLNQLVKDSTEIFGRTRKDISIRIDLSPDLLSVEADKNQIEQILWNLYANASDAMPEGGHFIVKTLNTDHKQMSDRVYISEPGNYVLLTATDTGTGMEKDIQERIFDPFFTTKEMERGTGLGLASAYGIIKSHNGYIDVDSSKGHGTRFSIYLPASEKKTVGNIVRPPEMVIKGTETILLVDDEEIVLDVGRDLLETMGYRVLSARDGQEALEIYKKSQDKIDIVILDMVMPILSGSKVYDELKEIAPDVKILLSSGYSIDGQAADILNRGCDGFIHKPFSINELSRKIRGILDKK